VSRQGTQPLIFELPRAPDVTQLCPFAWVEHLRERENRPRIKDREGIERHRLQPGLRSGECSYGRRQGAGCDACCGYMKEFSAI
jgi:hypothetical protein